MRHDVREMLGRARRRFATQVELQQRYLERTERSGTDALAASRRLRWQGSELVGDLIPPH